MLELVCVPGGRTPLLKSLKKDPARADSVVAARSRPVCKHCLRVFIISGFQWFCCSGGIEQSANAGNFPSAKANARFQPWCHAFNSDRTNACGNRNVLQN